MTRLLIAATIAPTLRAFLLPIARHFRKQGWQVDAMAQGVSSCPECSKAFDRTWEVEWSRNPLDPRNLLQTPHFVRELVRRQGYDLVHVHTPVGAFVTRYALRHLRRQGKPQVIYTAHGFHFYEGGHPLRNALFLALERVAGRWTDYLVVINREDERAAQRYRIVSADRVRYTPGIGVDTDAYRPEAVSRAQVEKVRQELKLGPGDQLLLMVAEFIPRKRHSDILRAFARVPSPLASGAVHLALAGGGPLEEQMKALTRELNLAERVHFMGFRDDVPALIRASVATVLCSEQEGLPRSVMESLSLQVPVIGTDIRGTRDLLEQTPVRDECGLLVPLGDTGALARAMLWILGHAREAENLGRLGRERMADYDVKRIVALHSALYDVALKA
jgi:glycosyltransferase involved in cell wall biosynthesis